MPEILRRDAMLRLKVETDLARAVDTAARSRGQTVSEFVRQSVRAQLAASGISLGDSPHPSAPARRIAA